MLTRAQLPYLQYMVFTASIVKPPFFHRTVSLYTLSSGTFRKYEIK